MCWKCEAIGEIDNIIDLVITKADQYQALVDGLNDALLHVWDTEEKAAIEEAIKFFSQSEDKISEKDVEEILKKLEERLSMPLAYAMQKPIIETQLTAYQKPFKEAKLKFSFNQVSKDALNWMDKNQTYWIGKYFSDQISAKLESKLTSITEEILSQGLGREAAGNYLRQNLKGLFETPEGFRGSIKNYFEGLSTHIVTQSREFGRVDAFQRAEIDYAKVSAILDQRTSSICYNLNGRIIPVSHMVTVRDKIISAKTPEKAKEYSPWFTDKQTNEFVKGKTTKQLLSNSATKYLGPPPYHFYCRTTLVMATKEEWEEQRKKEAEQEKI